MEMQLGREIPYSLRRLGQHRGIRVDGAIDDAVENIRRSGGGLRRKKRVRQGVCGVSVQLRTPKRRRSRETVQARRKSIIGEKSVEIYSRERTFSPTAVVIKTNPLFQCSGTPLRIPSTKEGELQLNVHQQSYIAKTKEEEMVNAIIELARHGEKTFGKKAKRKSLFYKAKSAIARHQRSKSMEKSLKRDQVNTPGRRCGMGGASSKTGTPFRSRYPSECLY